MNTESCIITNIDNLEDTVVCQQYISNQHGLETGSSYKAGFKLKKVKCIEDRHGCPPPTKKKLSNYQKNKHLLKIQDKKEAVCGQPAKWYKIADEDDSHIENDAKR